MVDGWSCLPALHVFILFANPPQDRQGLLADLIFYALCGLTIAGIVIMIVGIFIHPIIAVLFIDSDDQDD